MTTFCVRASVRMNQIPLMIKIGTDQIGDRGGCATNRKVAGSIPDGVIGIFH